MKKRLVLSFGILFAVLALAGCKSPEVDPADEQPAVINIAAIQGITVPATGGTPVRAITENAQYSGTVTWSPNHTTFVASTVYTATITLTAKSGYTLQGVAANFFKVSGATATNSAGSGVVKAVFPQTGGTAGNPTVISVAAITGVTAPAAGGIPVTAITENTQYSGTVTWNGSPSVFAASTVYTATITLTPKSGYTLQGVAANFFTVSGATTVSNSASSGVITAVFPQTGGAATVISTAAITGVTAPVTGRTPVTAITENAQYSGTVTWNGNPSVFAGSTEYTATITLTPKSGYTLQGVAADFFTVAGATTVSNSASSGVITAVFPQTAAKTATSITIKTQPDKLAYKPGDTLDLAGLAVTLVYNDSSTEDVAAAQFTSKGLTANPAQGDSLVVATHNGKPVTITYGSTTVRANTANLSVKTAVTDALAAPGLVRTAHNRILISVTSTVGGGRSIEYGISATNNAAAAVWQSDLLFTGLNTGTTYYIFARIAESANSYAGPASDSLQVTTRASNVLTVTSTAEWTDALAHISVFGNGTAETPQTYAIAVSGDVPVPGSTANSFGSVSNVAVTLQGSGKLYLNSRGNMIRGAQTLIIDSAVLTLQGLKSGQNGATQGNNASLIYCSGTVELKNGKISGNSGGGGVYAGTFTMTGGTISDNSGGGGVYAGTFTMTGGTISDNSKVGGNEFGANDGGGGVEVSETFTMEGGTINNNSCSGYGRGGGVRTRTFTMNGGIIRGNTNNSNGSNGTGDGGGGVSVSGTFTMNGGTISGNTNSSYGGGGGGVSAETFTINGGTISGNSNNSYGISDSDRYGGGGVYARTFTMTGGTISGNSNGYTYSYRNSDSHGGGVCAISSFSKTGGIIYGNDVSSTDKNTVTNSRSGSSYGYAVYYSTDSYSTSPAYYRDSTLGENDNLSSSSPLPANSGQTLNGWTKQ